MLGIYTVDHTMSTRKICLWGAPVVLLALAGAAYYFFVDHHQIIKFGDDSKVTLLAVDFGKKHVPPPIKATSGARPRRGNQFTTTNDTLVLWVQQQSDPKEWHNFEYYVTDKAGNSCVQAMQYSGGGGRGNDIVGLRVDAFPRRQNKFYIRVQENSNGNNEMAEKKFVVSNPFRGLVTDWTPQSLPVTSDDEDVSVTLTKLVAGAPMGYTRGDTDTDDPINKGVEATFHVERNGAPVNNWQPVSVVTTDATGNSINGYVNRNSQLHDDSTATYQWGLWTDEPAWKVRFEFSQQSDFAYNELWTVPNIPVVDGKRNDFWNYNARKASNNVPVAETDLSGIHVKIFPAINFTDAGNSQPNGGLTIETDAPNLDGMRMTVKIADDHANNIDFWDSGTWNNNKVTTHRYGIREMLDATNLTVSVALHKSRYVEFTVKPQKATTTDSQ